MLCALAVVTLQKRDFILNALSKSSRLYSTTVIKLSAKWTYTEYIHNPAAWVSVRENTLGTLPEKKWLVV